MDYYQLFLFGTHFLLTLLLGTYLMTLMQWYDYKISRVILRHHKRSWHLVYFAVPFFAYHFIADYFWIFFYFAVIPAYFLWIKKLDKRLVLTWRVKRFFLLLIGLTLFGDFLCTISTTGCANYPLFLPLVLALIGSHLIERFLFLAFKKEAIAKIERLNRMKVIAITGSYGKTSMKNFLVQLLSSKYRVYATPGNVNTLGGIVRDINEHLPNDTEIYIVEAGARERGDIYEIAQLVRPHAVVIGKVGAQHIEYFKTLDNIILTKMELIHSDRVEKILIHESVTDQPHDKVSFFGESCHNIIAHLDGTQFDITIGDETHHCHTPVLGSFQTINIEAAVLMAKYFRIDVASIIDTVNHFHPVPHRLEKIDTGSKIILDDSYNGNYEGMMEAIQLASEYKGRKVIVTPGLVESSQELNAELAKRINEVFDIVIITGSLNADLFDGIIHKPFKVVLKEKAHMQKILASVTQEGDLILFANDAPNFI